MGAPDVSLTRICGSVGIAFPNRLHDAIMF